jgi:hypothetical protein
MLTERSDPRMTTAAPIVRHRFVIARRTAALLAAAHVSDRSLVIIDPWGPI